MSSSLFCNNNEYRATLNEINKSLHKDKFSIRNRLLSIYSDHLFVSHIHSSYFKHYPLTGNLRCGSWYVYPLNNSCYFKSTDGHFGKWNFNLRRLNPNILKLMIESHGIMIVDSTRKGKVFPDALQRTIPIWAHVLNNVFHVLFNKIKDIKQLKLIPIKMPKWINDSEKEEIQDLTKDEWMNKVLTSNIINELTEIQTKYAKCIYLEPFWIDRFTDLEQISLEIKSKIKSNDIIPIILLTASRPLHVFDIIEKHKETLKHKAIIQQMKRENYQYIQGAADDHEHWSKGIEPKMFWQNYKSFIKCESNRECLHLIKAINDEEKEYNQQKTNGNLLLNEFIVNTSSKKILSHTNNMLYMMYDPHNININVLDLIKMLYDQQETVFNIMNSVIICVGDINLMQKCIDYMKQNDFDEKCALKIGVYFVLDSKKYKKSLENALKLILNNFNEKEMNKIWIYQDRSSFDINIIGCIAASIILHCIVNASIIHNKIDTSFWMKSDAELHNLYLSKTKIRNVMHKFQFIVDGFHPSRLLIKQINNYFLSF